MNTTTSVVAAGAIVTAGRWTQEQRLDVRIAIGTAGVALILSLLAQTNERLAQQFGMLILLAAAFAYLPGIVRSLRLTER